MSRPDGIAPIVIAKFGLLVLSLLLFFLRPLPFVHNDHLRSFVYVATFVSCAVSAGIYWLVWKGEDAGRWLLMIGAVLTLFSLRTLHSSAIANPNVSPVFVHAGEALVIVNAAFGLFLLWYLNTAPVRAWFQGSRDRAHAAKPYLYT